MGTHPFYICGTASCNIGNKLALLIVKSDRQWCLYSSLPKRCPQLLHLEKKDIITTNIADMLYAKPNIVLLLRLKNVVSTNYWESVHMEISVYSNIQNEYQRKSYETVYLSLILFMLYIAQRLVMCHCWKKGQCWIRHSWVQIISFTLHWKTKMRYDSAIVQVVIYYSGDTFSLLCHLRLCLKRASFSDRKNGMKFLLVMSWTPLR